MRHGTLALAIMVLLGVGLLSARLAAEKNENPFAARLRVAARLLPRPEGAHIATPPSIDCAMPVIKGDPKIDPEFVKPLPPDAATHTLIVIPVPSCPERTSDYSYRNATIGSTRDARRAGR